MAKHIAGNLSSEFLNKNRAFRPRTDEAHLPPQNIPELRQFIERKPTQNRAHFSPSGVPRGGPNRPRGLGFNPHGPKLEHVKLATIEADTTLATIDIEVDPLTGLPISSTKKRVVAPKAGLFDEDEEKEV